MVEDSEVCRVGCRYMNWIAFTQDGDSFWTLGIAVINFGFREIWGNCLLAANQ